MSRSALVVVVAIEVGLTMWLYTVGHPVLALVMIAVAALTGRTFRSFT